MKRDRGFRGWRCFWAGLLLSALTVYCATAAAPKRILILNSFGRDVAPYSVVVSALRTKLARELGQPVDVYEASLDMARFTDPGFEKPFVDFLEQRFAGRPVELVVPVGAPAATFAAQYRERLFKETPLVFAGVDPRILPANALPTNATLVTQRADLSGMIEDLLQIQPDTTNVAVVFGASPLEQFWVGECRREWQAFTNRVNFSWLDTLPLREIQERTRNLPPRSFVVFGMMLLDTDRVPYNGVVPLRAIHDAANAPLYGYFRSQFGLGTIGGRLYQDSQVGAQAAQMAIRILRGESAADIPPEMIAPAPPLYDWRELKRWNISPSRLPAGSIIEFREPRFGERYWLWILAVVLFCCLQTALIIGLIVNRAKRREQEAAANLIANLSSKFIHLPSDELDREIKDAQRRICECLGLDLSALWQWADETPRYLVLTHLYRPLGGPPTPERFDSRESFPWCAKLLQEGKMVAVTSLESLPPEAARDRQSWQHYGIKSNLTFPLSAGRGRIVGALGFNTVREERDWSEPIVRQLQLVAQIFANALGRKVADQSLKESEMRVSLAADSAEAGLWELDCRRQIFWVTDHAREIFGYSPQEVVSLELFETSVHPKDRELVRQAIQHSLEAQAPIRVEYRIVRGDGQVRWIASRGRPFFQATGEPDRLMGVSNDITERKQAEEALRDFSARLIQAQEQERARLARELHDDITQRLARLAIDVGRREAEMAGEFPDQTARAVREELVRLSEDVHALSYRLHPSILEDLGLVAALKAEAERFERQGALPIHVKLQDIPEAVPGDVALGLFRVAQEALRNATRHANARTMKLSLRGWDGGLQLAVQDDGGGFDPARQRDRSSLGLASMRERVHLLRGELEIESAPGQGTTVLAWVPLPDGPRQEC